jgi:hypothetical protein
MCRHVLLTGKAASRDIRVPGAQAIVQHPFITTDGLTYCMEESNLRARIALEYASAVNQ